MVEKRPRGRLRRCAMSMEQKDGCATVKGSGYGRSRSNARRMSRSQVTTGFGVKAWAITRANRCGRMDIAGTGMVRWPVPTAESFTLGHQDSDWPGSIKQARQAGSASRVVRGA